MFEAWKDYFLLVGSAAAALIGLLFVVVTLTAGRELNAIERGQKLYMTPIVFSLGVIVLLSGIAMTPVVTPPLFAAANAIMGLIGLVAQIRITMGLKKVAPDATVGFDVVWYGMVPAIAFAAQLAAALLLCLYPGEWTLAAVGGMVMAQLLIAIHNEWDLVTYLAPRTDKPNELH